MHTVKDGDRVRVHFTCNFDDSSEVASTGNEEPLELTIGECKRIECFEKSMIGMTKGQKKTAHLQPYQAMGEKRPELISQIPLHLVPEQDEILEVGGRIQIKDNHRNDRNAIVTKIFQSNGRYRSESPVGWESADL